MRESATLKMMEPMSTYGVCTWNLMHDISQGVIVSAKPNHDNTMWECSLTAVRPDPKNPGEPNRNPNQVLEIIRSDFTKKGAQRIASLQFLQKFNDTTKKVWQIAKETAAEKFRALDGQDKTKLVNQIFQRLGMKKPSAADNGLITWNIYGKESIIKALVKYFFVKSSKTPIFDQLPVYTGSHFLNHN